jgi:sodium/pantothenate symporter
MTDLPSESYPVLLAFGAYLIGVMAFGIISHRYLSRSSFVKDYFVGGRGLGAWVLALTVAATAVSGGTFMGYPSFVYSNGWVMALWIASYMMVPLTAMALMGKRINQVARVSGAVTVPDVFRDRFNSPALGLISTFIILFLLTFNLVAQFKGGASVMKEALKLTPPPAKLVKHSLGEDKTILLEFETQGRIEKIKTVFPSKEAQFVRIDHPEDLRELRIVFQLGDKESIKRISFPPQMVRIPILGWEVEKGYLIGMLLFAFTVIAYTAYGGFWAVTWTDVFEGLVMLVGVILLAVLAIHAVPENPKTGSTGLAAATESLFEQDPRLVYGPGPDNFLPLGMAFSFFLMWSVTSPAQSGGMVRLMSFKDSQSLRKAMVLIAFYYLITYVALLVIFICARAIYPTEYLREMGSEGQPDSIMPAMARKVAPTPFLAGLLLAAPYAAIMSTVAAFLLLISSSLVRDIYQRTINPKVSQRTIQIGSYTVTVLIGLFVTVLALNPPDFLQYIIVFTGSGQGAAFLFPMLFALYSRRATKQGVIAGMVGGFFTVVGLYVFGWIDNATQSTPNHWIRTIFGWLPDWGTPRPTKFESLRPLSVDPVAWGLMASFILTFWVSRSTKPDPIQTAKYFPT